MAVHQIGIRELVEFLLRTGDLSPVVTSENTAQEGSRIHRKIQRSRPTTYQSEVALKTTIKYENDDYVISGRADGIDNHDDKVLIEEIKTSDLEYDTIPQSTLTLYWGQVKVYAYIVMHDQQLDSLAMQLTYVQTPDELITTKQQTITKDEADDFFLTTSSRNMKDGLSCVVSLTIAGYHLQSSSNFHLKITGQASIF
nr:PD-(D/E)XK nuclease family protein [Lentilactobacillus kisonensis]